MHSNGMKKTQNVFGKKKDMKTAMVMAMVMAMAMAMIRPERTLPVQCLKMVLT